MIKIAKEKRTFATKFKQMLMKETLKSYFGYVLKVVSDSR